MNERDGQRLAWDWPEMLAAFLLGLVLPSLAYYGLHSAGVFVYLYGPERGGMLPPQGSDATRFSLYGVVLAFPVQLAAVLGLLWSTARVKPADLGLPGQAPGRQIAWALALGVVLIPLVYGVQWLTLQSMNMFDIPTREHAFTKIGLEGLNPLETLLLILAACVVAPVWEELFFRGLLQPWVLAHATRGEAAALAIALGLALLAGPTPAVAACAAVTLWPFLPRAWRGIYAASVVFAFVHSAAWPSPIPLLVLAIGLGALAQRSGGLVGVMVLHALFNAVACVVLLAS
jgi:membrane protease YdiL (CAAX protease family)